VLRTSGRRNLNHADSDPATHAHSSRRKQTKNHRRICRTREFQNILGQCRPHAQPTGMARARADSRVRRVHHRSERNVASRAQGGNTRRSCRTGNRRSCRRVGPLFNSGRRRSRVRRSVPARILYGNGPPGRVTRPNLARRSASRLRSNIRIDRHIDRPNLSGVSVA
jgi:hypothetical protein